MGPARRAPPRAVLSGRPRPSFLGSRRVLGLLACCGAQAQAQDPRAPRQAQGPRQSTRACGQGQGQGQSRAWGQGLAWPGTRPQEREQAAPGAVAVAWLPWVQVLLL
jgi:hypothetical protein